MSFLTSIVCCSGVPMFSSENANELRRFIVLIDVLYERQVRLIASGLSSMS